MITVFYDGKCSMCSREINHYRNIAPTGIFIWQDITQSSADLALEGVALSEGLRRLHAKDADGQLKVGVDAFILIWKQLKRWRILGFFVALPIIRQIAKVVYGLSADWRFKRLDHCQLSLEKDSL